MTTERLIGASHEIQMTNRWILSLKEPNRLDNNCHMLYTGPHPCLPSIFGQYYPIIQSQHNFPQLTCLDLKFYVDKDKDSNPSKVLRELRPCKEEMSTLINKSFPNMIYTVLRSHMNEEPLVFHTPNFSMYNIY